MQTFQQFLEVFPKTIDLLQKQHNVAAAKASALYKQMQQEIEAIEAKYMPPIDALRHAAPDRAAKLGADIDGRRHWDNMAGLFEPRWKPNSNHKINKHFAEKDLQKLHGDKELFNLYMKIKSGRGNLKNMDPRQADALIDKLNTYLNPITDEDGDFIKHRIDFDPKTMTAYYNDDPDY